MGCRPSWRSTLPQLDNGCILNFVVLIQHFDPPHCRRHGEAQASQILRFQHKQYDPAYVEELDAYMEVRGQHTPRLVPELLNVPLCALLCFDI